MKDILKHAFDAAQHAPQVNEYLKLLHFRQNGIDISVKPSLHKTLLKLRVRF